MTNYASVAPELLGKGLCALPQEPAGRFPSGYSRTDRKWYPLKWGQYRERRPSPAEVEQWSGYPEAGVSLLMGEPSGVIALDFDERPELHALIQGQVPGTPVKKKGVKGETWFYRYDGQPKDEWVFGTDAKATVELLSDDRLCTIPPSVHHTGVLYEWVGGVGLLDVDLADLPELPYPCLDWLSNFFDATRPSKPPPPAVRPWSESLAFPPSTTETDHAVAEAALRHLEPEGRRFWIRIGMAIADKFPGDAGFALWEEWSRRGSTYEKNRPGEMRAQWRSFKARDGGVTFATLVHEARERGFDPKGFLAGRLATDRHPEITLDTTALLSQQAARKLKALRAGRPTAARAEQALPEPLVSNVPGLVGDIARWIGASTFRHQPHFALAAALGFVGVLKGHRVRTASGERTNHMCLALGKSGSGKSEAGNKINQLVAAADLNRLAMGVPASDSGLRAGLSSRGGRAFIFWDEMGLALEKMLNKNSPGYYRAVKDLLVEVYTGADGVLRKKEVVSKENQANYQDIDQPCLGFYGTAQPDIFYAALSGASAADGFFPRLLVFDTPNHYPRAREVDHAAPPQALVDACWDIESRWPTNAEAGRGNLDKLKIAPRVVPWSPAAKRLLDAVGADVQRKLERSADSVTSGVWARTMSHVSKIALTVASGPEIGPDETGWAIDLMLALSATMTATFEMKVSDSPVERDRKRVLELIVRAGPEGIPNSRLTNNTPFLRDKMHRNNILSDLEESELVVGVLREGKTKTAKLWVAVACQESNAVGEYSEYSDDPKTA